MVQLEQTLRFKCIKLTRVNFLKIPLRQSCSGAVKAEDSTTFQLQSI